MKNGGCFVILFFGILLGALCWPYTINTWLVFIGKEATITWWQGAIIGFVPGIGHLGLPCAFFTWLLMLFL